MALVWNLCPSILDRAKSTVIAISLYTWVLQASCHAVLALLSDPDAKSPLNCDVGNMVRGNDMTAFHTTDMYLLIVIDNMIRTNPSSNEKVHVHQKFMCTKYH